MIRGYATCAVGEEAIDIPELSVVHLVRRTKSKTRNMQAVGRALRPVKGKKAIVVDYQTMIEGVRQHFVGVTLDDLKRGWTPNAPDKSTVSGDPLVTSKDRERDYKPEPKDGVLKSMTMEEERAFVLKGDYLKEEAAREAARQKNLETMRKRVGARVEKVAKMVIARGGVIPGGWKASVLAKLMEAEAQGLPAS